MKYKVGLFLGIFFLLLLATFSFTLAIDGPPHREISGYMPGEILIGFKADTAAGQIETTFASIGGEITGVINLPNVKISRIKLPSTAQSLMDTTINALKTNPLFKDKILYAEPNIIRYAFGSVRPQGNVSIYSQSSDPLLSQQWGYYDIGADWLSPPLDIGKIIAVIDTGVDYMHRDLKGKVIKGYDYANHDADPMDDNGHGTHVAGIAAAKANNAYGIAGVSWYSQILAIKVLNSQGWGTDFDVSLGIIDAADYPGVKVINMSFGGAYSSTEEAAVQYAVETRKKLIVAAAGNGNTNIPVYPAGFSFTFPGKVLAVAAHGIDRCKASFSNYGTWVSITAPGDDILSTVPSFLGSDGFDYYDGTSVAAPFVSGAAALAWAKHPTYKNTDIADLITTKNAGYYDPLVRDNTCWPSDSSTFQALSLFHIMESKLYETCDYSGIFGYALDAETGTPLAGAVVRTKQGLTWTGNNYVPYYGKIYAPSLLEGYGLFNVLASPSNQYHDLIVKKEKYAIPKIVQIYSPPCGLNYAGNIPVPPNKKKYWFAVTWDYGYTNAWYDSLLYIPVYGTIDPYADPGSLNSSPWAKVLWDSDYGEGNLKDVSEVIRVERMFAGNYVYYVDDWLNGDGSSSWSTSGIKAYIYKWDSLTSTQKLVKTIVPPAGSGRFWHICNINGNIITDVNVLTDNQP